MGESGAVAGSVPAFDRLREIAGVHGDAFFIFEPGLMREAVRSLRAALSPIRRLSVHYSVKTNSLPAVCEQARQAGIGVEVASLLEFNMCRRLGIPGRDIVMSGVGRGADAVWAVLQEGGILVVDGDRDAEMVLDYASAHVDEPPGHLLLRVRVPTAGAPNPRLGMMPEHALAVAERLEAVPGVDVVGLHAHVTDRSEAAMQARVDTLCSVAEAIFPDGPPILDLGGSLPSVAAADAPRELASYAHAIASALGDRGWGQTVVLLEPGNALIARAVSLVARVLDVRVQPGRMVATVAASVLHSSPIRRRVDFPVRVVADPLVPHEPGSLPLSLAGATLIDGDWLSLDLPWSVEPGDFVVLEHVGAYSMALDNSFIEAPLPVVEVEGDVWRTARSRPEFGESFAGCAFPPFVPHTSFHSAG